MIRILVVFMAFKYLAVRLPQLVLFSKLYSTLEDSEAIYFHQKSNTTNVNIKKSFINKNIKSFKSSKDPAKELLFIT